MSIASIMTTVSIALQTPMAKIFGDKACYVFWMANVTYTWKLVTSGTGMTVYRLLCLKYLFKKNLNTNSMARKILIGEWIITLVAILAFVTIFSKYGWEKSIHYQFCMDMGHEQVETLHQHKIEDYNDLELKSIQAFLGFIARCFILLELVIYLWIIHQLWKHDEENYKEKIITDRMRQERKHKDVVTLKGQVLTFIIEIVCSIYIGLHNSNPALVDASTKSITLIVTSSIISVVQILTSHEMMRFIRGYLPSL